MDGNVILWDYLNTLVSGEEFSYFRQINVFGMSSVIYPFYELCNLFQFYFDDISALLFAAQWYLCQKKWEIQRRPSHKTDTADKKE